MFVNLEFPHPSGRFPAEIPIFTIRAAKINRDGGMSETGVGDSKCFIGLQVSREISGKIGPKKKPPPPKGWWARDVANQHYLSIR